MMGMYDNINGEQVKCFSWVTLCNGKISYHGGDLKYYGIGNKVPYRRPHYNYGKNFIILDLNRFPESDYCPYDYILHVIVDGKVKNTFENEIGDIDWSINNSAVGYTGELLNINNADDVLNYIKGQREYWDKYKELNSHWDELFKESMTYFHGIGLLDENSEEKKYRRAKLKELHELMDKESERISSDIESLAKEYSYLYVNTSNLDDLINLGDYISAYYERYDTKEKCRTIIHELLDSDNTLYDRYVKWQGTNKYIKIFKKK